MQTLLVIENNLSVELLKKLLGKIDFVSPIFFKDPKLALEWCATNEVDVIMISLPKRDAFYFMQQFQNVLDSQYVPVLMMASTRDIELKIKAFELNVTDFISIPVDQIELKHRIKNAAKMRMHQKSHLLAQKRIFELQKLEAVNCLTAGVAHEFNNLLSTIQGLSDLNKLNTQDLQQATLTQATIDELSQEFFINAQRISMAVKRGKLMVEQMLVYCRRDETLSDNRFNFYDFIKQNTKLLKDILPENVKTVVRLDTLNSSIYMESINITDLRQIFWNLFSNARDVFGGKSGTVEIEFELINSSNICSCCSMRFQGNFFKIDLSDNGQGINEEILPRIFDPFFTTKEVGSGTGLGLSVVAGLIHNAQGHIQVISMPDVKTTFSLFFPYTTQ